MRSRVLLVVASLLTPAAAQSQSLIEDFHSVAQLAGRGWVMRNNSQPLGTTGWFQGDPAVFPAQDGAPNEYIAADFQNGSAVATISNWLLTPPVTIENGATLVFWTRKTTAPTGVSYPDRLQVRMSTAGVGADVGTTATDVGTFTMLLADINPTYGTNGYPLSWTRFEITVSGLSAPAFGRLAFRYFVEQGGPAGPRSSYIGIDAFEFADAPAVESAAPAALSVDSPGNGVLQPNEAVVLSAPTWRNTSTVTIGSLTGSLQAFTGPAGGAYTVDDGTAAYGALGPGASAECSDCYAVTVSAAARPATHWDASAFETVSAGATQKQWTLHIGDSFSDVPDSSPFYRFIETLLHKGVTGGCSATQYCPAAPTSRAQMAVFVLAARQGTGYTPPACGPTTVFADVPPSSPYCAWIEELARRGVVGGCGGGNYCPAGAVTREQMSIFVLRTLDPGMYPPACSAPPFGDVPATSPFCRWIAELARRNIVNGCGGGNYCPLATVSREQMGVFISATFGLTLYGP
jgi:hypothetical protein